MSQLGRRNHLYHLVDASPWPLVAAIGAFFLTSGLGFFFHRVQYGIYLFFIGFFILIFCMYFWFRDICIEASYLGYHTIIVRRGLKIGFLFFLASEIMLFFGFFWAFFHSSLCPSIVMVNWPPFDLSVIYPYHYPFFNTILLISSGFSVTWAHRAIACGSYKESIDSFAWTIILGFSFVILQGMEYYDAAFNFSDGIYAATFYSLTGLHGFHVVVGAIFIFICFIRLLRQHFLTNHYLGFVCAIWYWHFVDVVWLFLFLGVYCWGNW